jgi:hypothetical protein
MAFLPNRRRVGNPSGLHRRPIQSLLYKVYRLQHGPPRRARIGLVHRHLSSGCASVGARFTLTARRPMDKCLIVRLPIKLQAMYEQFLTSRSTIYILAGVIIFVFTYVLFKSVGSKRAAKHKTIGKNILDIILSLKAANAQWPLIMSRLNPKNDKKISKLLLELRGPHMFVPHIALNILEDASRSTLRANPHASLRDILDNACRSMKKVTQYGD